jgi:hypothetical protein
VGLSESWLGVRVPDDSAAEAALAAIDSLRLQPTKRIESWQWARLDYDATGHIEIGPCILHVAAAVHQPVFGGWVFDSDFGLLIGANEGGEQTCEFAVNAPFEAGDEEEQHLIDLWLPDGRHRAAESLAAWSKDYAPVAVDEQSILSGMPAVGASEPPEDIFFGERGKLWFFEDDEDPPRGRWVFAEDCVRLIYHRLGFGQVDRLIWSPD